MSEVVLLLPNTHCLQQVEDYVRGCATLHNLQLAEDSEYLVKVVQPLT
jgi:hypothetical protein